MATDIVAASPAGRLFAFLRSAAADASLRQRLQSGFLWNIIAAVFNQGSTFALGLVVANLLGREVYGRYGVLQSTLLLFGNVAQFAVGYTTTKFVAEFRSSDKPRVARIIAASLTSGFVTAAGVTLVAYFGASFIAVRILEHPELASLIRLGAAAIGFIVLNGIATGALAGFEDFRGIAYNGIYAGIVYIALGAFAAVRWGLPGVIVSIVISSGAQAVVLVIQVFREAHRQGTKLSLRSFVAIGDDAPMLINYGVPAALAGFSAAPVLWIVTAIMARQLHGITEVALFTAANSIRLIIMFVPYLVNRVAFSLLNNYRGTGDGAGYRRAFWTNTAVVTSMTVAGVLAVWAGSPLIMRAFGRSFVVAGGTLVILAAATIPEAVALGFFQIMQTRGMMWTSLFRIAIPRDFSTVVAALLFVPRYGSAGAALAFLTGAIVFLIANLLIVRTAGISSH